MPPWMLPGCKGCELGGSSICLMAGLLQAARCEPGALCWLSWRLLLLWLASRLLAGSLLRYCSCCWFGAFGVMRMCNTIRHRWCVLYSTCKSGTLSFCCLLDNVCENGEQWSSSRNRSAMAIQS